jgi:hypothetical protein
MIEQGELFEATHCEHGVQLGDKCRPCDEWWQHQAHDNREPLRWRNGLTLDEHPALPELTVEKGGQM